MSDTWLRNVGGCVFCDIVLGKAPADIVRENSYTMMITPLNPVVGGHLIVLPRVHVRDFMDWPYETGMVMQTAAEWAQKLQDTCKHVYDSLNIITSVGEAATQSVMHMHVHIVPRAAGDGLTLPWTDQVVYNKATEVRG